MKKTIAILGARGMDAYWAWYVKISDNFKTLTLKPDMNYAPIKFACNV